MKPNQILFRKADKEYYMFKRFTIKRYSLIKVINLIDGLNLELPSHLNFYVTVDTVLNDL